MKQKNLEMSGIPMTQRYDKYLDLPALVGKSRQGLEKTIGLEAEFSLSGW